MRRLLGPLLVVVLVAALVVQWRGLPWQDEVVTTEAVADAADDEAYVPDFFWAEVLPDDCPTTEGSSCSMITEGFTQSDPDEPIGTDEQMAEWGYPQTAPYLAEARNAPPRTLQGELDAPDGLLLLDPGESDLPAGAQPVGTVVLVAGDRAAVRLVEGGPVDLTVQTRGRAPVQPLQTDAEVVEVSVRSAGEMSVVVEGAELWQTGVVVASRGPGTYRVRISHVVDDTGPGPSEHVLVQSWPAPSAPPEVLSEGPAD